MGGWKLSLIMSSFLNSAGLMINNIQSSTWHMRYDYRVSKRLKHTCHSSDIQWSLLNANAAKSYISTMLLYQSIFGIPPISSFYFNIWCWWISITLSSGLALNEFLPFAKKKKRFILNICNHWVFSFFPFLSHIILRHHDMPNKHL